MIQDRVWELSTDQFEIVCEREEVLFSDLISDNNPIERAVETGSADVVRLIAEVRSKGGVVLGRASKDALEILEGREPFDVFKLDRSIVRDVVLSALAHAIDYLEPGDDFKATEARMLRQNLESLTII